MPDKNPTVAMEELLLVHVPPSVALLRIIVSPVQTDVAPDINPGDAVTVIVLVADTAPHALVTV
jgi:hypothetical protein